MTSDDLWRELDKRRKDGEDRIEGVTELDPGRFIITTKSWAFYGGSCSVKTFELYTARLEAEWEEELALSGTSSIHT